MTPEARCATCGAAGSLGETIQALTELGFGPEEDGSAIQLCRDCLDRRNAKAWAPGEDETQRLVDALKGATLPHPQGRYSYLADPDEGVHLVRLQNDWLRENSQPA